MWKENLVNFWKQKPHKSRYFCHQTTRPEWFHLGVQNRENKPLKFLHKIILSVFPASRIAVMKQETFCWLYQSQINHSNLHNCNIVVPLMETLKQNRPFLLLFRRWYYILKNIKSIRQLVVFKITNVNVGQLYKFPTYVTQDWTNLWQYTINNAVCFIMIINFLVVKAEGEVSWPWSEC